jgi:DnaJ like chaperone protein
VDLMEGLFHIAMADGVFHPQEEEFLREVSGIFGLTERSYTCVRAQYLPDTPADPYDVLAVSPDAPLSEVRAAYKRAVRQSHPDQMIARGVPVEAITLAERRMVAINRAWDEISTKRAA